MSPLGRAIVILFASAFTATPFAAGAQSAKQVYRIGILTELAVTNFDEQWRNALRKRGYIEGENVLFEVRAASEKYDLLPKLATDLVESKVDVILTASTPTAVAAKQATTTIPIVTMSADPLGAKLVSSLARPGGNVTRVLVPLADLAPKRLQLLKEAVPGLASVAVLWNPQNQAARLQASATEAAARDLGIRTIPVELPNQDELNSALHLIAVKRPHGLIVVQDLVTFMARQKLAEFAIQHRLPASHAFREFVVAGGLMSYGNSAVGLFDSAAVYVDKILKGAKPADLPMEQPTRFEFVINLKTAKVLGLNIPQSILLRADEVIR